MASLGSSFPISQQVLGSEILTGPIANRAVDFSVTDPSMGTMKKVAFFAVKMILFPWGLYELLKFTMQRVVMIFLYPAQSRIVKLFLRGVWGTSALDRARLNQVQRLRGLGFTVRDVVLMRNGVRYNGITISRPNTIENRAWAIQATGNSEPIEHSLELFARVYGTINFNILLINGPQVGRSEGHANPDTMADVQELGIRYLEEALSANKVILAGRSLGGAVMGGAILKHEFKPDIQYTVVRQMSFDRASNVCSKIIGMTIFARLKNIVKRLVGWCCELDGIAPSRKLSELNIKEVIVQSAVRRSSGVAPAKDDFSFDNVIPKEATLGYRLVKEGVTTNKVFCCAPWGHVDNETIYLPLQLEEVAP